MRGTRREFLIGAGACAALAMLGGAAFAQAIPAHPDPTKFESGDFIWPAKPDAFIPFDDSSIARKDADRREWEAQREIFLEEARRSNDPATKAAAERLEKLSYDSFHALYFDDRPADVPRGLAAPFPDVGHCAVLDIDASGVPWVVEAIPRSGKRYESIYTRFADGVVRTPYAAWIAEHPDYRVWHGRVNGFDAGPRAKMAEAAKVYLTREYWFWSFDLADETAFYCSKLLWIAAQRALGIALDDDPSTSRSFWVSPKRLINARTITLLHNPGRF
jgi:hypothetical protein